MKAAGGQHLRVGPQGVIINQVSGSITLNSLIHIRLMHDLFQRSEVDGLVSRSGQKTQIKCELVVQLPISYNGAISPQII